MLVVGLDESGKSRIVKSYGNGQPDTIETQTHPTVGFNVKTLDVGPVVLNIWDGMWLFYILDCISGTFNCMYCTCMLYKRIIIFAF